MKADLSQFVVCICKNGFSHDVAHLREVSKKFIREVTSRLFFLFLDFGSMLFNLDREQKVSLVNDGIACIQAFQPGLLSAAVQFGFAFGFWTHSLEMDEWSGFSWFKPGM